MKYAPSVESLIKNTRQLFQECDSLQEAQNLAKVLIREIVQIKTTFNFLGKKEE